MLAVVADRREMTLMGLSIQTSVRVLRSRCRSVLDLPKPGGATTTSCPRLGRRFSPVSHHRQ